MIKKNQNIMLKIQLKRNAEPRKLQMSPVGFAQTEEEKENEEKN